MVKRHQRNRIGEQPSIALGISGAARGTGQSHCIDARVIVTSHHRSPHYNRMTLTKY